MEKVTPPQSNKVETAILTIFILTTTLGVSFAGTLSKWVLTTKRRKVL